ncbi:MAG TPA: zinc-dependent metalloprotease [Niastella sp.]
MHDWYFIQAAAIDPRARKMTFDDELMGSLIRFVSSHEIGHTLGLRHNMGSSSLTPVEKLRDKAWVEAHGHTASIMDYARFNYVAQPEDNISEKGIYPRIGEYDKWTIQWGYGHIDGKDENEDKKILNKLIIDSLKANPRLWFSGEGKDYDPRSQSEDLSDNALKANEYGIKNLKRIMPNLIEWTKVPGEGYIDLAEMYNEVMKQLDRYLGHALKFIGGVEQTAKTVDQPGDLYTPTPKAMQKEAVAFICRNILQTPTWLLDKNILNKISHPLITDGERVASMQKTWLTLCISGGRLNRANIGVVRWGAENVITPYEILQTVHDEIWSELRTRKATDNFRRNLQKAYVSSIAALLDPAFAPPGLDGLVVSMSATAIVNTDIKAIALAHLIQLKKEVTAGIAAAPNAIDREHLQYVLKQINKVLDDKK